MTVLSVFIQDQRQKSNLFLLSKDELSQQQAVLLSNQFAKLISNVTEIKGQINLLDTYRAIYLLLNEVYIVVIGYLRDYPYEGLNCSELIKTSLYQYCKGFEITPKYLTKNYLVLYQQLEEILYQRVDSKEKEVNFTKEISNLEKDIEFEVDLEEMQPELILNSLDSFNPPQEMEAKMKPIQIQERFKELKEMDTSKDNMKVLLSLNQPIITPKQMNEPTIRESKLEQWEPIKIEIKEEPVIPKEIPKPIIQEPISTIQFLPLRLCISETIHCIFKKEVLESYKMIGQIGVKKFSNETLSQSKYKFDIYLNNSKVIDSIINNKSLCNLLKENVYQCEVPIESFGKNQEEEVVLLKYTLTPEYKPLPLQIQAKRVFKENSIHYMIKYKMNPNLNMDILSFLVHPKKEKEVKITKVEYKPEAKWNSEKLLWKLINPEKENKLMVIFKTDQDPSNTTMGPLLLQFHSNSFLFSRLTIDGCDGKKNESNQVFVGGCEMNITSGKYEFD